MSARQCDGGEQVGKAGSMGEAAHKLGHKTGDGAVTRPDPGNEAKEEQQQERKQSGQKELWSKVDCC